MQVMLDDAFNALVKKGPSRKGGEDPEDDKKLTRRVIPEGRIGNIEVAADADRDDVEDAVSEATAPGLHQYDRFRQPLTLNPLNPTLAPNRTQTLNPKP